MPRYSNMNKETNTNTDTDTNHVTRPPNCFMLWSCDMRKKIVKDHNRENNADISKQLGQMWMNMSSECKLQYRIKADKKKYEHKILYPNYKYTPKTKKQKNSDKSNLVKCKKKFKPKKMNIKLNIKSIVLIEEPEPDYYKQIELFYKDISE